MKFTATLCNFNNEPGYMLEQYDNEFCICSQFIPEEHFLDFCKAAGIDASKIEFK